MCLFVCLSVCLFVCLFVCLQTVDAVKGLRKMSKNVKLPKNVTPSMAGNCQSYGGHKLDKLEYDKLDAIICMKCI